MPVPSNSVVQFQCQAISNSTEMSWGKQTRWLEEIFTLLIFSLCILLHKVF